MLALEMLTTIAGINLPKAQHAFGEPISIECRNGVSLCLRFLSYVLTLEMLLLVEFDATPPYFSLRLQKPTSGHKDQVAALPTNCFAIDDSTINIIIIIIIIITIIIIIQSIMGQTDQMRFS